jgi:hypothetical protein
MFWIIVSFLIAAMPAWANCRVEKDHYGGGTVTTQCDDGYRARTDKDHYGGQSTYSQDNRGHRWTTKRSIWGGPDTIDEH